MAKLPEIKVNYLFLLAAGVLVTFILFLLRSPWMFDFWIHSAVVREFAANPFSPQNPLYPSPAYDFLLSPYHFSAAMLVLSTGFSHNSVLAFLGIFNLLLFLLSLHVFSKVVLKDLKIAPVLFFFSVALWGSDPWFMSDFLHLKVFFFTLPYPALFCWGLFLLTLSLLANCLEKRKIRQLLIVISLSTIIVLSHPITGIFLIAAFISLGWYYSSKNYSNLVLVCLTISGAFGLALIWPYFSFVDLLCGAGEIFDKTHRDLYDNPLVRIAPSLLAFPLLLIRLKRRKLAPLDIALVLLIGIYGWGWISEKWTYGRVLPYIVFILHVEIADCLIGYLNKSKFNRPFLKRVYTSLGVVGSLLVIFLFYKIAVNPTLPEIQKSYSVLSKHVGRNEVVLSDPESSLIIPAFSGKIVYSYHALPTSIAWRSEREKDILRFFQVKTLSDERLSILRRYNVKFILLNKEKVERAREIGNELEKEHENILETELFLLFKVGVKEGLRKTGMGLGQGLGSI